MELLTPIIDAQGTTVFNPPEGESRFIINDVVYVVIRTGSYITLRKDVEYTTTTGVPVGFNNPMREYWKGFFEHQSKMKAASRVPAKKAQWKRETNRKFR